MRNQSLLIFVVLLIASLAGTAWAEADPSGGVKVTFLANEGVLLEAGGEAVMIDGFVTEPYSEYGALPAEAAAAMTGTSTDSDLFSSVTLALASHVHRDHFQPEPASAFLAAYPEVLFASSPQVLAGLPEGAGTAEGQRAPQSVLPAPGETEAVRLGEIKVEVLRLRHGGRTWEGVENLGHLIHLGGRTILHIGDADTAGENFAAYDLASRNIDLALVPYWFFFPEEGRKTVEEHLIGREVAAVHIPPKDFAEVTTALAKSHPKVRVPRVLETFQLK